jgi:hypothetical protein
MANISDTKKRVTISISQVAPLIGLDNYGNFPRIVCEIWRRYNPIEFRDFEIRLKTEGNQLANASEFNDFWETDELLGTNILEQVKAINSNTEKTSAEMIKGQTSIKEYIQKQKTLTNEQKDVLITKVCSATNKSHGITNEDAILAEFCRLCEKKLQNNQGWVEIPLLTPENPVTSVIPILENKLIEWIIIGKYDGVTTDGELVEAKMRQKGLFKKMRDYENVQVQLYLHALGYPRGFLVEGFTSKKKGANKSALELHIHDIEYDAGYVEEVILERLRLFAKYFEELMLEQSPNRKENILKNATSEYAKYQEEYLGIASIDF